MFSGDQRRCAVHTYPTQLLDERLPPGMEEPSIGGLGFGWRAQGAAGLDRWALRQCIQIRIAKGSPNALLHCKFLFEELIKIDE